jgi:hypothetical protein
MLYGELHSSANIGLGQDLGSILTFLQICRPLDNEDFYKRLLLRPLKDGDPAGAELLRVSQPDYGRMVCSLTTSTRLS